MEEAIIRNYKAGKTTLSYVAEVCGVSIYMVKRTLNKHGIPIILAKRKTLSEAHKKRISESCKGRIPWSKGKKASKTSKRKNMAYSSRFDVDHIWLEHFTDINKVKFLNLSIRNRGKSSYSKANVFTESTEWYKSFISHFYHDLQFSRLYSNWMDSGKRRYMKPSLDHKIPLSKGGKNDLENLQFLTWFENRAKNDMSQHEWAYIKVNIKDYIQE